ncbi:hypothetical protein [Chryseobacterium sp. MYb328]|uniref:hypothetical protein n=1 Tax=Chryseobacterium sp. MYb328 TaxID=2745231 RepID=UPI00309A38E6
MAKITAQEETLITSTDKPRKKIKLEFVRFGKKGGAYSKEYFKITTQSGSSKGETHFLTLEDLKNIIKDAEPLIKAADDELI